MEFKRDLYLNKLISKKDNSLIKVITGARRVGKSYLLNKIYYRYLLSIGIRKENIIMFSFDKDEDLDLLDDFLPLEDTKIKQKNDLYLVNSKKFRLYIKSITNNDEKYYLLLDEIQLLDSFVGTLNSYIDNDKYDVYVTGSNSQLLSSEIETKFRGRKSSIHVLPLSFSEYLTGVNQDIESAWKTYIVMGGIPLVYKMASKEEMMEYLVELSNEVYLKDIIGRKNIKDLDGINELFDVISSTICSYVSPLSLERYFKENRKILLSDDSIDKFIDCFSDAFVMKKAYKYNIKGKTYINRPYKIYFEDIGVRNARIGFRQIEETKLLENIIYNELRYRGYSVDVGEVTINEKTDRKDINNKFIYEKKNYEVDFIAYKGDEKVYIQSCLSLNVEDVEKREKRSLYYIDDSFKKVIVTKDGLDVRRDDHGLYIIDIFDFLLKPDLIK